MNSKNQHNKKVVDLINSLDDRDSQEEMLAIHKNYSQVIGGFRIAKTYLIEIDETTGTDHSEMLSAISDLITQAKYCEMDLLEMCASLTNCYNGEEMVEAK